MRKRQHIAKLAVAALTVATVTTGLAPPALAATTESGDAGDTLATAQEITGYEDRITGTLGTDDVDIYKVYVTEPEGFSASTFGSAVSDTLLILFDAGGHLVAYSDDWTYYSSGWHYNWSNLPAGGMGNPYSPSAAGWYYLAVAGYGAAPQADGVEMDTSLWWDDVETGEGVSGSANATEVLSSWSHYSDDSGDYTVSLNGVGTVTTDTLYALGSTTARGAGASSLFTVDLGTGQATLVGPVTVGTTQLTGLGAMDVGPDGTLYAADNNNQRLVTIDPSTGAATVVGAYGSSGGHFADLAFDQYGFLYGWNEVGYDPTGALFRIYPDGRTAPIGDFVNGTWGTGLAVGPGNVLWVKSGDDYLARVNPQTGLQVGTLGALSGRMTNSADFVAGYLYSAYRPEAYAAAVGWTPVDRYGTGTTLKRLDPATGLVTAIGHDPDVWLTGLTFSSGISTAPAAHADVRMTVSAAPSPQRPSENTVVTVALENRGPDTTEVTASLTLGTGLGFISADGEGTYDPIIGAVVWPAAPLAPTLSQVYHATLVVAPTGDTYVQAAFGSSAYTAGPLDRAYQVGRGAAPVVTDPPRAQRAAPGSTAQFTSLATGNPQPTVQWEVLTTEDAAVWTELAGETSGTLSVAAAQSMHGYQYRAVFSNTFGTVASDGARLWVGYVPTVTTHPADVTRAAGQTATFTVAVTGTPTPTISWEERADSTSSWTTLPGENDTSLVVTATLANNGHQFRAFVWNDLDGVWSNAATLTVTAAPAFTAYAATPSKGKVVVTFTVTGLPAPLVYVKLGDRGTWSTSPITSGYSVSAKGAKTVYLRATNAHGTVEQTVPVTR